MAWHRVVRRGDGVQVGRRDGALLRSFLKRTARWRTPRGACLTASDCRRAFLAGCSAEAPQMASANTVCRIVSTCAGPCKIGCSSFWSLQQRCSSFRNLICGARLRTDRWRFAEAKWTLFRAFCVTPSSTMPQQREPQNESTRPNRRGASSGLVPRPRTKVPHAVAQSRSLEDASSPRGAPSQTFRRQLPENRPHHR